MAYFNIARGGQPDFKGWMCAGQYAEYGPDYNAPHLPETPPFDSHADAAFGQGYLNLQFPLIPRIGETQAHRWMQNALKGVAAKGDVIFTNWVPTRSYVDTFYYEVNKFDSALTGVYIKPVAYRVAYNFNTKDWDYTRITAFDTMVTGAGLDNIPLGTPADGEQFYGFFRDTTAIPVTFGHNIPKVDSTTKKPTGGIDAYFGNVLLGYTIVDGTEALISELYRGDFALYFSGKLMAFEGSSQVG